MCSEYVGFESATGIRVGDNDALLVDSAAQPPCNPAWDASRAEPRLGGAECQEGWLC